MAGLVNKMTMKWWPLLAVLGCAELDSTNPVERDDFPWAEEAPRLSSVAFASSWSGHEWLLSSEAPVRVEDCETKECDDQDNDGLTDEWENAVADHLRPIVEFDTDEPMFVDRAAMVTSGARVFTVGDEIRVVILLIYRRDYGRCGVASHRGDVERVAFRLRQTGPSETEVVAVFTAGHEGTSFDSSRVFAADEMNTLDLSPDSVTGQTRWRVWASEGKHATYASRSACEENSSLVCAQEDCGGGPALLVPTVNLGEPGSWLVPEIFGQYLDEPFCGGRNGHGRCVDPIMSKLGDPFVSP